MSSHSISVYIAVALLGVHAFSSHSIGVYIAVALLGVHAFSSHSIGVYNNIVVIVNFMFVFNPASL